MTHDLTPEEVERLQERLRRAATTIYLAAEESVADSVASDLLIPAAGALDIALAHLKAREEAGDSAIWLHNEAMLLRNEAKTLGGSVEDAEQLEAAADALTAQAAQLQRWKQPYVHCFTCGAPAHKVIHLPEGCAALPEVKGIVGICPQHEISIEPVEPYRVLCDFSDATAQAAEIARLRAELDGAVEALVHTEGTVMAFLNYFNPTNMAEDKSQQWFAAYDQIKVFNRAFLDRMASKEKPNG